MKLSMEEFERRTRAVRVRSVKVVFRAKELMRSDVDARTVRSCMWPRVTFELDGGEKKVPFTGYAGLKKQERDWKKPGPMEKAIMRIVGEVGKLQFQSNRWWLLHEAVRRAEKRIDSALHNAVKKKSVNALVQRKVRNVRRTEATEKLRVLFEQVGTDLMEHEVVAVFRQVKAERLVRKVIES